ncbi:MAG: Gfo/Idh/MocA family oxidoreductase [Phycisphaerae bacterium]|nr:Gfo/Idh/MocA family oxidoreductase [Phycisphaerae bacterium]
MSKNYRVGIIGYGAIGYLHARAIADLDNAHLVAAFGMGEKARESCTGEFGAAFYEDYEQLLEKEDLDVVTVATPSGAHLETALAAIGRGRHVLCEKPLEIRTERIDQLIAAAAEAGVMLGGIFPQRFNPVVQAVQSAAAAGRFGELATISSYVPWWRDDAYYAPGRWQGTLAMDGGGALMNQSIHGVDALQWIAQGVMPDLPRDANPVEQVFAYTAKRAHAEDLIEVEDTCVVVARLRNGALGQILATTSLYPGSLKRLQVGGRDGTAEVLEDELVTWQFRDESPEDEATRGRFSGATSHGGGAADPMAIDYGLHTKNIAAFLGALDRGEQPEIDGVEARKAVAIIEAVYESAASGRAVDVQ